MTILITAVIIYLIIAAVLLWVSSFSGKLELRDYRDALLWIFVLIKTLRT